MFREYPVEPLASILAGILIASGTLLDPDLAAYGEFPRRQIGDTSYCEVKVARSNFTRIAVSLMLSLFIVDAAGATERLNFFRVRQGYATGNAKNGVAKVHSQVDRGGPLGMAGSIALYQVARLARASGMTHFVVVKSNCSVLMINNIQSSDMCDVKARFGSDAISGDLSSAMNVSEVMRSFEENEAYWRPY